MSLGHWLQDQLLARRIVLVTGRLVSDAAAEAAAALMALDANADKPIDLHSADGTLEGAFVLIDTLDRLRAILRVQCRGRVGGPAIGVIAAAHHRSAAPHARFLSQPTERFAGTPDEIAARSRQQQDLLWRLYARLARRTGRPRRSPRTCGADATSTPRRRWNTG